MTPYYADDHLTLYGGDCRDVLRELPAESVHCVVTSPPYWGLRDYGTEGQLGLEPTPEAYVANMVDVFREVRRVLRDDGTLWLNLGDSYAGSGMTGGTASKEGSDKRAARMFHGNRRDTVPGLAQKQLIGIPWRVAFALQQPYYTGAIPDERDRTWLAALVDGEGTFTILSTTSPHGSGNSYPPIAQVRMTSQAVVAKAASLVGVASPAQYPPSNRGNRAVYQWRLSGGRAAAVARELYPYLIEKRKQALIVWNHQAVRDSYETKRGVTIPTAALEKQRVCRDLIRRLNHAEDVDIPSWMVEPPGMTEPGWYLRSDVIWSKPNPMPESVTDRPTKAHEYLFLLSKSPRYYFDADAVREPHSRNLRSVWTIATEPYPGAHFATFPRKLVEPCVKAGTSERGVCPECGAPWVRVVERERVALQATYNGAVRTEANMTPNGVRWGGSGVPSRIDATTTGWRPSCAHDAEPVPATVLDPFAGSGTTLLVAQALGRRGIGIDLSPDYLKQAIVRASRSFGKAAITEDTSLPTDGLWEAS